LSRLYVGNLAHETTEADLRAAFSQFGEIASVKVASDRRGRMKGFAYVDMAEEAAASQAMASLRGTQLHGRTMDIVEEKSSGRRGGGFRAGGRRRH
jgi:RNA recognition motif-containing protein